MDKQKPQEGGFYVIQMFMSDCSLTLCEMNRKIIDSHFHIFDLEVKKNFPNQNVSHGFPEPHQKEIFRWNQKFKVRLPFYIQDSHHRRGDVRDESVQHCGCCLCPVLLGLSRGDRLGVQTSKSLPTTDDIYV